MRYFKPIVTFIFLSLSPLIGKTQNTSERFQCVDDTLLSYTISFDNPLTDTAHSIVIIDTISPYLDVSTFELSASSHPFEFAFLNDHVACWIIPKATLPPGRTTNFTNHGFVRYHIDHLEQHHSLEEIQNNASIYFGKDSSIDLNLLHLYTFDHYDYDLNHERNDLGVDVHHDTQKSILDIGCPQEFNTEQVTVEIFNEQGELEFIGKLNNYDHHIILDTGFLQSGAHMLSVYDNHHHETWQHIHQK